MNPTLKQVREALELISKTDTCSTAPDLIWLGNWRNQTKSVARAAIKALDEMPTVPTPEAVVSWDDEDQVFIARFPGRPGCVTHGATVKEALLQAADAVAGYDETLKKKDLIDEDRS